MKTNDFSPLIGEKFDRERTFRLINSYPINSTEVSDNPTEIVAVMHTLPINEHITEHIVDSVITGRSDYHTNVVYDAIKSRAQWLPGEE